VFEAAGAGACLITDYWKGIDLFLEPNREVLVAASANEVAAHLEALTPVRAGEFATRARRRILAHHTYGHRALQVHELLEGSSSKAGAAG
jgi:spore maturation protein CgeB